MRFSFVKLLLLAGSAIVFTGCGDSDSDSDSEEFGTIRGTITYEGEVVEDAVLTGSCDLEDESVENDYQQDNVTFPYEYEFQGLVPGTYEISFRLNNGNMSPEDFAEIDFSAGEFPEIITGSYNGELVVTAGGVLENINIVLAPFGEEAGENTINGTVFYDGEVADEDVLRGYLFDNAASSGMPSHSITTENPIFPQAFTFESIPVGDWFVSFVFDIDGDSQMGPGDEDLTGALVSDAGVIESVTLEEGGNVTDLEITIIP